MDTLQSTVFVQIRLFSGSVFGKQHVGDEIKALDKVTFKPPHPTKATAISLIHLDPLNISVNK